MDLLEDPDVKDTYNKCKYTVKLWEHKFTKDQGRLPSKLDIREADKKVRDAYKQYYQLKTAALEQSFRDVDGFNSDEDDPPSPAPVEEETNIPEQIWGYHLDQKVEEDKPKPKLKSNFNSLIKKKLFCGSKFTKRNPRKSLSFSQRQKSEVSSTVEFLSQPISDQQKESSKLSFEGLFTNVKIAQPIEKVLSQPMNITQMILENKNKTLKSVDSGWLERVGSSSGIEIDKTENVFDLIDNSAMNLNYDSDEDVIDSSDEETAKLEPPAKKPRVYSQTPQVLQQISTTNNDGRLAPSVSDNNRLVESATYVELFTKVNEIPKYSENSANNPTKTAKTKISSPPKVKKSKTKAKNVKNRKSKAENVENHRPKRSTRSKVNMGESHSDEDPYHTDSDPEYSFNDKKFADIANSPEEPKIKAKRETKIKKSKKEEKIEDDVNDAPTYELEYSVKPRNSTPRYKNIKKLIKNKDKEEEKLVESGVKSKRQMEKDKLEKKIESGSLNDNFVTINLKKKVYVRGKKNVSFSKYKKQQWKNKKKALAGPDMDMGGCDGGMLTCFKCGDIGHFARYCKKTKGDTLKPLENDEEECPFPTLEEAAKAAKESVLAIRQPNVCTEENENAESDNDSIFNDGNTELLLAETLRIEEHLAKVDMQSYLDHVKVVEPYYKLDQDRIPETPQEVFDALEKFGYSSFRSGQETAIMRILSGRSTLVTLSTGSGKSLCYQLPAYLYSTREPCITLVVSPLVSLMEDQVTGIPSFLKAACLHNNQTKTQREKVMDAINSGNLNVILVSPEAVVAGEKSTGFGSLLRKLPPIAFACIDEAHCVSQWSHNFRPSYLMICRVLRERLGIKTILGLTATATRATSDSIIRHIHIPDGRDGIITDVPLPDNLILTVSKDSARDQALHGLITSERFSECKSIIIYCTRREECERVTKFLRTTMRNELLVVDNRKRKRISVQVEPYHAGLSASRRRNIQKAFMSGELRIVVATVAFGMGINKSDIRAVIHYNMPKSFESYVQEVGRAGRDGLPAHCHLFLDPKGNDENELRRHIHANSIDRHVIRKLLEKVFIPCSCKEVCPKHEVAFSIEEAVRALDVPEENISTLLCYLELHEKNYIELLSPAYTRCKVVSYGGAMQIRKSAKECPPLAMALALQNASNEIDNNVLEFAVVDIAATMGWDSGICKHKLKNLEWTAVNGQPKRSLLNVQFSNLGFRLLAPGNLTGDQLDEALDSLYERVVNQEKTSLLQLRAVHQTVIEAASSSFRLCVANETPDGNLLKSKIREYFESPNPLDSISLEEKATEHEDSVLGFIRGLISTYRDNNFTGRAVARILHGIQSPNYPAVIWGRCKYWRCLMHVEFHTICKLATKEILSFR